VPYFTEFVDHGTGIVRTGVGTVTGAEVIEAVRSTARWIGEPSRISHGLVDFSKTTAFEVSTEQVQVIAELDHQNATALLHLVFAVVAPTDLIYGSARMYEALMNNPEWSVEVFRTVESAKAWVKRQVPGAEFIPCLGESRILS
jgi:hypothetical protein